VGELLSPSRLHIVRHARPVPRDDRAATLSADPGRKGEPHISRSALLLTGSERLSEANDDRDEVAEIQALTTP
jgi:hypothetical protein